MSSQLAVCCHEKKPADGEVLHTNSVIIDGVISSGARDTIVSEIDPKR